MASKSSDNSVEIVVAGPATTMSLFETTLDAADDSSSTRNGGSTVDRTTGTSRGGSDQHHQHHYDDDDDIAKKETQLVMQQRLLVGSLLLVAGVAISLVVYLTTSRSEHREFRAFFSGGADKILSTFNDIVREKVSVVWVVLCVGLCACFLS
jgi:Na+/H+ antiporter NhaB